MDRYFGRGLRDLRAHADALQRAVSPEDVAEISVTEHGIDAFVYTISAARRLRRAARKLGVPDTDLRIIKPLFYLVPFPTDSEENEKAYTEFLAENVRMITEDAGFQLTSLEPVIGASPRVLVLGSMPGEASLQAGEYYAHPRNRFWLVVESVLGIRHDEPYQSRIEKLTAAGIALWDVLKHCERIGSLDANIPVASEEPNAVAPLLVTHQSVRRIVLNGRKAAQSYSRLIAPTVPDYVKRRVEVTIAPSTSPANARETRESLTDAWKELLTITA